MPTLSELFVYPIKSCAGIALERARLEPYGLAYDRNWMIVDPAGRFVTQREFPRLALVRTALTADTLVVEAPGMAPLVLPLDPNAYADAPRVAATVWRDTVSAIDTGDDAARWLSGLLGVPLRLVRFDPAAERIASRNWTGEVTVPVRFADGFPLLVIGSASLDDLNGRLARKGVDALPMNRFRPNLVIDGLDAYEEDFLETLQIETAGARVEFRIVKPCARCPIPTIDQARGAPDPRWPHEPTDTMSTYRANDRLDGALTFGQNAIPIDGSGAWLAAGQSVDVELRFAD
jgi:uncharacterized protein YcbX